MTVPHLKDDVLHPYFGQFGHPGVGYRVGELPVPWFNSLPSRVHAIWHSLQMLKDLLRIRVYDLTGAYSSHVHGEVRG